jgi:transcription-repair coupling factor (superfamily II helicase)
MLNAAVLTQALQRPGRLVVSAVPGGLEALVLADTARAFAPRPLIHVARDDQRLSVLAEALALFAPDIEILRFPAWDCLPYDRVSPAASIVAQRLSTLARLAETPDEKRPRIIVTTVNAALQRLPPREMIATSTFAARPGQRISTENLQQYLLENGFSRTGTVVDPGDFAVRGGLIDIYPPGVASPIRLDFFGDTLESIRSFDAETQRTTGQLHALRLDPASEVQIKPETIARFRTGYSAAFGGAGLNDPLYEAVSAGRRQQGMEHWLALFYDRLETLFDHVGDGPVSLDHLADEAVASRREQIADYYVARTKALGQESFGAAPYKPLEPESLYPTPEEWTASLDARPVLLVSPFEVPEGGGTRVVSAHGRQGRNFAAERESGVNVYEAVREHAESLRRQGKRVVLAAWSEGSGERLEGILRDHELKPLAWARSWAEVTGRHTSIVSLVVLRLETGFETDDLAVIAEQDILGDRLIRSTRRARKASDVISELSSLSPGDLVVHVDHGIGRFEGLRAIEVQGAPHDCLFLTYAGSDRLFLPVENLELLTRYGSEESDVQLDRLGGGAWQARKARLKERVREIAEDLIRTAAERELKTAEIMTPPPGLFDEFCARFPFEETEDQLAAIEATLDDLQSGRPMDRLVCGDVGFGKTEVALRTAFIAVMSGKQVAVIVPTTLLARQHYATFSDRFHGYPVNIAQVSRLVPRKEINAVREGLASGSVDIVIGTHALLTQTKFRNLGLLVIDEEQHFGVKHKERLKDLKADMHVLTLTATPIPRTLQLALSGVRELSLITTAPLDRLAVRTFISPFDPVIVREMLLREHYRGGQSFYVVPRIADIGEVREFLQAQVPEVKFAVAHGRLAAGELDDIMSGFYDRKYDVLLSTSIIESGLDIPSANTLIVHRSDRFGLAQLYQLRGRVGRSKQRAYALFTVPPVQTLTPAAEKRLKVLQSLDTLGAGFMLASHDLDIRGAGNLLGEEQSGHIREVGFELYQALLEEAVSKLRSGELAGETDGAWSPQINIGTSVLIPEVYVPDLQVRLGLYRRLADLEDAAALESFGEELRDRFGPMPDEVRHLLDIVSIKLSCREANVASIDAGPKGVVIGLRGGEFANPEGLVRWIAGQGDRAKLRPDMKLVVMRDWPEPEDRLKGARRLLGELVPLAQAVESPPPVASQAGGRR